MQEENQAPEEVRPTAAQLKAQIEEKQRELKQEAQATVSEPKVEAPSSEPLVSQDQVSAAPAPIQDKPAEPAQAGSVPPQGDKAQNDAEAFAKKKGWKDVDALLQSYRHLEKKLGERKVEPAPAQAPTPEPLPFYQTPKNPDVREIAAQLFPGINPEDAKVFVPAMFEVSKVVAQQVRREMEEKFAVSENRREREREVESLKQDRHFQNPEVLSEIGSIFNENPRLLQEQGGLTFAFNQALANVGRKRLEGTAPVPAPTQGGSPVQTTPPTTARGTGPTNVSRPGISSPTKINPANFNGLPLDEKRRALKAIGAWKDE